MTCKRKISLKTDINPKTVIYLDLETNFRKMSYFHILDHVKGHLRDKFEIDSTGLKYYVMVENLIFKKCSFATIDNTPNNELM